MLKIGIVIICILSIGFFVEAQPPQGSGPPSSGGGSGSGPPSSGGGTGGGPPGMGGANAESCDGLCGASLNYYYNEYYEGDNHIIESNHMPNHVYN